VRTRGKWFWLFTGNYYCYGFFTSYLFYWKLNSCCHYRAIKSLITRLGLNMPSNWLKRERELIFMDNKLSPHVLVFSWFIFILNVIYALIEHSPTNYFNGIVATLLFVVVLLPPLKRFFSSHKDI